jgi:hypothetical protein
MNPTKTYFHDLSLLSHASPFGVTYVAVAPCSLASLLNHASAPTVWHHKTKSCHMHWRDFFISRVKRADRKNKFSKISFWRIQFLNFFNKGKIRKILRRSSVRQGAENARHQHANNSKKKNLPPSLSADPLIPPPLKYFPIFHLARRTPRPDLAVPRPLPSASAATSTWLCSPSCLRPLPRPPTPDSARTRQCCGGHLPWWHPALSRQALPCSSCPVVLATLSSSPG